MLPRVSTKQVLRHPARPPVHLAASELKRIITQCVHSLLTKTPRSSVTTFRPSVQNVHVFGSSHSEISFRSDTILEAESFANSSFTRVARSLSCLILWLLDGGSSGIFSIKNYAIIFYRFGNNGVLPKVNTYDYYTNGRVGGLSGRNT